MVQRQHDILEFVAALACDRIDKDSVVKPRHGSDRVGSDVSRQARAWRQPELGFDRFDFSRSETQAARGSIPPSQRML